MAYYLGSANSLSDLQAAIMSACGSEGWTVIGSDTLQQGAGYFQLSISGNSLRVRGGTGSGGGVLSGAPAGFGRLGMPTLGGVLTFPVSYEIHIHAAPAEVYVVVNTNVDIYTWLAFGLPNIVGLAGTGAWFSGSWANYSVHNGIGISATSGGGEVNGTNRNQSGALFWQTQYWENSFVHHNFESGGWGPEGNDANLLGVTGYSVAVAMTEPLIGAMPSAWNGAAILLPIQPHVLRPGSKRSMVADLGHARYTRVDNYNPGQIITLGAERWKVYPWYRKDSANRNGGDSLNHTGTFGWAIRYDGP